MFLYQCGLFVFEIIKLNHILEMQPTQLEWAWLRLPLELLQLPRSGLEIWGHLCPIQSSV